MSQQNNSYVFNLSHSANPSLTRISVIRAKSMEDAKKQLPEGWIIITSREYK